VKALARYFSLRGNTKDLPTHALRQCRDQIAKGVGIPGLQINQDITDNTIVHFEGPEDADTASLMRVLAESLAATGVKTVVMPTGKN
jgi:hypothetical protein